MKGIINRKGCIDKMNRQEILSMQADMIATNLIEKFFEIESARGKKTIYVASDSGVAVVVLRLKHLADFDAAACAKKIAELKLGEAKEAKKAKKGKPNNG
jgi:predicted component of type VI protein secretion system